MGRAVGAWLAALCVAAGAVAGCGGGPGSGAAAPSAPSVSSVPSATPLAGAPEPFEPCQTVPGEVLEANGFDPGSAKADAVGKVRVMLQCRWRTLPGVTWHRERYSVTALRYEFEVGDLRGREDLAGVREVEVNGRAGLEFGFPGDDGVACYLAFGTRTGRTAVVAVYMGAAQVRPRVPGEPECTELLGRHARWLEPYLPR